MEAFPNYQNPDIRERLARLETASHYERHVIYMELGMISARLDRMDSKIEDRTTALHVPLGTSAWLKVLLAIMVPLMVYVSTGSLEKALTAQKLSVTPF